MAEQPDRGNDAAKCGHHHTRKKPVTPANMAHQPGSRQRANGDTDVESGDGGRGKRFVRAEQIEAGETTHGNRDRGRRSAECLRGREQQRIAPRQVFSLVDARQAHPI
jgi:hypothetical protein